MFTVWSKVVNYFTYNDEFVSVWQWWSTPLFVGHDNGGLWAARVLSFNTVTVPVSPYRWVDLNLLCKTLWCTVHAHIKFNCVLYLAYPLIGLWIQFFGAKLCDVLYMYYIKFVLYFSVFGRKQVSLNLVHCWLSCICVY